ncbi:tetratricopeptide repeat protein [Deinococcus humi]|uniref:Tetratricopeptide (TPR) repeat protein n=1 Tax=Deinococcus humi TaxID=662880 RepID=A0A7W8NEX4_9DEIO|nr:tetratricopeptide repeat protein [Deinococcus humi]MBB5363796.1 tetratricopeptide (TPR) repeat protein [Deinococcus humi]GGO31979.1 hypothetical protein GCM10008949_28760 [Deinococcus humi]
MALLPLPVRLLQRLQRDHRDGRWAGVVAPVEVGANQSGLTAWAEAQGWTVWRTPPPPEKTGWLWLPAARQDLQKLPYAPEDVLVLGGADLCYTPEDWAAALPDQTQAERTATFAVSGGWPGALELARQRPGDREAYRQPQASVLLAPFLPPEELRSAARVLAVSPLVTPGVGAALDVAPTVWQSLVEGGWLWPAAGGWAFPSLLRRVLTPDPDPGLARRAAQALQEADHTSAALEALADAALWTDYLSLLIRTARTGQGEAALRAQLRRLPERWRTAPEALYLAGLVARVVGDLDRAETLYTRALTGLVDGAGALVLNARGVVRAMRGEVDGALDDFTQAAQSDGRTAGEASQNRATLLVQLGRHAEAESSLNAAVAAFREAGDLLREVYSLQTLGSLHFGRGLLREALGPYRKSLQLSLADFPEDAVFSHLNLAESHIYLGEFDQAEHHLQAAAAHNERHPSSLTAGWMHRVQAILALQLGEGAQAIAALDRIQTDDRSLQAETALLRVRAYRELGQPQQALATLQPARPLGLRAELEEALLGQAEIDPVIEAARQEEARLELVTALLHRSTPEDLQEALELIRQHGYLAVLGSRAAAPLASLAQDPSTRALFPLRIQTLGPLRFTHAGRQVQLADFPTRKSAALLVALALAEHPQSREVLAERFWPGAKNPLASLQTAIYHLRSTFGVPLVGSERGLMSLLFPVQSDLADLRRALQSEDLTGLAALLRPLTAPLTVLSDLPAELTEERAWAEHLLHDALRLHAQAQPAAEVHRRDALRALIATDPLATDSREDLIRWHELHGEEELAEQERRHLADVLRALGVD